MASELGPQFEQILGGKSRISFPPPASHALKTITVAYPLLLHLVPFSPATFTYASGP